MKKFYLLVLGIVLSSGLWCSTPKEDKKKTDATPEIILPQEPGSIVYALPRTGFSVNVTVVCTEFFPGPYAEFTRKYLGDYPVDKIPSKTYALRSIEVSPTGSADCSNVFVSPDPGNLSLSFSPGMVLAGINCPWDIPHGLMQKDNEPMVAHAAPDFLFPDQSIEENYFIEVNSETGEETIVQKTTEEKAREAADFLSRIRKKRAFTILSASDIVPEDGLAYQVFVEQANKIEKEYLALFLGKKFCHTQYFTIPFYPDTSCHQGTVLFRFSGEKGILPVSDISGRPIMAEIVSESPVRSVADSLNLFVHPVPGERGFFYRIPARTKLSITDGMETLFNGDFYVGQLGPLARVPAQWLTGDHSIVFDPLTGALLDVRKRMRDE
ncbi:MAG TPA: DUF4831 family protein [Prolixibacteraceae bacterium]|nr:DUF4831 family protein [Prolixibacteraceae bacterium]